MGTVWELGPSSQRSRAVVRLAQSPRHRTAVSLLQDGINCSFWMAQLHLTLSGSVLEEIHLNLDFGQTCPVSRRQVSKDFDQGQ